MDPISQLLTEIATAQADLYSDKNLDNGLNVRCKNCQCWASKRFHIKDGLCPDCG